MASKDHQIKNGGWMFFLIIFIDMLSNGLIDGSKVSNPKTEESEDDIIKCVDIYKQPAFSHPFLKNHTIQMKPSSGGLRERKNTKLLQEWNKKASCPEGTIPILKSQKFSNEHKVASVLSKRMQPHVFDVNSGALEYCQFIINSGTYFGASGGFNIWHPTIYGEEFSSSQMWVQAGSGHDLNSLEAGWRVLSGETKTSFFIYWTTDIDEKTGCYNLECPGFVQTNNKIALGYDILPISIYGGKQYDIEITIFKDMKNGNWWLEMNGEAVGYWHPAILTSLSKQADTISWGGKIYNSQTNGRHTSTQMGSGHPSNEGNGKASMIYNVRYVDELGGFIVPEDIKFLESNPDCYNITFGDTPLNDRGMYFYFGGPGFSKDCP
uniref:Neprosin PEP catalytic domain-containing protein n=1 Tax=Manihot esculenta TaxID=3983 RepID=A0A2C9U4A3_MANES